MRNTTNSTCSQMNVTREDTVAYMSLNKGPKEVPKITNPPIILTIVRHASIY